MPGLARQPATRQRRRDELAVTLTLVVVGLVLAPPTGWLLGAWLADLTRGEGAQSKPDRSRVSS